MNLWECWGDDRPGEIGPARRWIGFFPSVQRREEQEDATDLETAGLSLIKLFMGSGENANRDHRYIKKVINYTGGNPDTSGFICIHVVIHTFFQKVFSLLAIM